MKWKRNDSIRKNWRIAVAGIGKGVGVTHFSILLGAYLRCKNGEKVCIVDLSGTGTCMGESYTELENLYFGHNILESGGYFYSIHKLDFFVGAGSDESIKKVLQENYDAVIFDCGTKLELLEHELVLCDRKFVLGCCSPWNQRRWETYLNVGQCKGGEREQFGYRYGYSFGAEENAYVIAGTYKVRLMHIPFIENPFSLNQIQMQKLEEIIWEESIRKS